ncbi:MAG TPA: bifunctional pyr operon transcriptional regulator/uracil phosphoribosyltransferase PyrR [Elusimicrobia bacterium]|nr:MAG: bifunctional pyr operon transcriptional regulator/uracil phosphoribosyltransferase [Elusimicrobia bacterium RIFOXYA12_FULL_49_49]OGS09533.1 MAG: bifunctional pyr operon transcriptional regulator/uracil phosphoribosyltransferase [Elusimicrobia bacterium RIFOXYA1_FULL_47_7]OGS10020.1 MAG: bifunctional pyr operon transcriptional regulator/uracil phosphoribosyltransferase [Elusimicrobia bacterium RIFOXYB1_FULL_48_9]OGS15494.1 MAG: bifunctional pyr operon transcriptional regulator/uracil phos
MAKTDKDIEKKVIMNKVEISRTIKRLAHEIVEKNFGVKDLCIVGIQSRGVPVARRIHNEIISGGLSEGNKNIPFGMIDINLYRDDVGSMDLPPQVRETDISFDIVGKKIVLVDDVIFTGRSIRAALDEIMDFGRPQTIELAVLVDRGHRELPIEPNFVGKKFLTSKDESIAVELEEVDGQDRVVLREKK